MFTVRGIGVQSGVYTPGVTKANREVSAVSEISSALNTPSTSGSDIPKQGDATTRRAQKAYDKVVHPDSPRRRLMFASDLMSKEVVTLKEDALISEATRIFTEKRFRHIPVVSTSLELTGMLSDRDVLRYAAQGKPQTEPVRVLMSHPVVVASFDTEIREIARVLFDERIGCMPIALEDGSLGGIITRSDILRTLVVQAPLELWR